MSRKTHQGKHLKSVPVAPKHRDNGITARSDAWKSLVDRTMRVLLAFSVIVILVPAVQLVAPGLIGDVLPWMQDEETPVSEAEARVEEDAVAYGMPQSIPATKPSATGQIVGEHDAVPDHIEIIQSDQPTTTTTSLNEEATGSSRPASQSSSTNSNSVTTQESPKPAPSVEGEITGNACPCTVNGTVELKGNISLEGDLMVVGGTLVARPGVNLNGNGFQIMFMDGGKADFQGTNVATWSNNGASQNLKRDINFRNMRRIMFHQGAGKSSLRYFAVHDSGTSALGDYPIHFHLNGNSTRGTLVQGVVVVNGRHHAFVPHGSHGITFKDTIAKNTMGDAYWWDGPGTNESCSFQKQCTLDNSNDITYDHALADGVTNGPGSSGFSVTGFLLGAGSGNVVRNSAAINIKPSHVKDCSGFHWPERAAQNRGGNVWVAENLYSFSGSSGPSGPGGPQACHGIFVWQNDYNDHVVNGFSGGGIDHGAYSNRYRYRNVNVQYLEIHATGWEMRDSSVGKVLVHKHVSDGDVVLTNVQIDSVTMNDAPSGAATEPIRLIINDSNISCSDVVWDDAHPESQVIIDGQDC